MRSFCKRGHYVVNGVQAGGKGMAKPERGERGRLARQTNSDCLNSLIRLKSNNHSATIHFVPLLSADVNLDSASQCRGSIADVIILKNEVN